MYDKGVMVKFLALLKFEIIFVIEYKVQVVILKFMYFKDYFFYKYLVVCYCFCEQVWVVEIKKCFCFWQEVEDMCSEFKDLGYFGVYLVEVLVYEQWLLFYEY